MADLATTVGGNRPAVESKPMILRKTKIVNGDVTNKSTTVKQPKIPKGQDVKPWSASAETTEGISKNIVPTEPVSVKQSGNNVAIQTNNQTTTKDNNNQIAKAAATMTAIAGTVTIENQPPYIVPSTSDDPKINIPMSMLAPSYNLSDTRQTKNSEGGKFAYAFLLGGAMSNKTGSDHRGGLYSVLVAAHTLRRQGSTADVILMVQLSALSPHQTLPALQEEALRRLDIRVIYLPKYAHKKFEKFYALMMEKFRILELEEYDRILYLDYDVMPKCNLDYMMELSYRNSSILKENVVLAHLAEPSSGGFFILKPNATDYKRLQRLIVGVENRTMDLKFPHWDQVVGWGHEINQTNDYWVDSQGRKGYLWNWYGVSADQVSDHGWKENDNNDVGITRWFEFFVQTSFCYS
jgi:hypothetical protein